MCMGFCRFASRPPTTTTTATTTCVRREETGTRATPTGPARLGGARGDLTFEYLLDVDFAIVFFFNSFFRYSIFHRGLEKIRNKNWKDSSSTVVECQNVFCVKASRPCRTYSDERPDDDRVVPAEEERWFLNGRRTCQKANIIPALA